MVSTVLLLGGNGYLGKELTRQWHELDPSAQFVILSRSGRSSMNMEGVTNIAVNVTDFSAVKSVIPAQVDYVVDLIGRPEKDAFKSVRVNDIPAQVMQQIAEQYGAHVMGFIGGKLGPKAFLQTKDKLIRQLQTSSVPLAYVEPTLVYGAGRRDSMTKMVPLLKFLGLFVHNMRPVKIETVIADLLNQLLAYGAAEKIDEN
ncbi:NAD-dependent epimerase/dehydratase family protein [Companilactobacillus keshanensis]|uniref:NAD-dependent epimerase/dehydratase family protein n=1 Tax=Companilactobacillus keshanensis TaxID=2486003 RepID=A0ABW4BV93_9LACO|nr:NAD-dependent epimerase/dehydratase family protein [Companilactobacillus keshanensis]